MRVGLLGGTFDPAHEGHIALSRSALDILPVDVVWWEVSWKHPFKKDNVTTTFRDRIQYATALIAQHAMSDRIKVWCHEYQCSSSYTFSYTFDLCHALQAIFKHKFIWMMGSDHGTSFHHWHRWEELMHSIPVVVFRRSGEKLLIDDSPAFSRYRSRRCSADQIMHADLPAWTFMDVDLINISSTQLRATGGYSLWR